MLPLIKVIFRLFASTTVAIETMNLFFLNQYLNYVLIYIHIYRKNITNKHKKIKNPLKICDPIHLMLAIKKNKDKTKHQKTAHQKLFERDIKEF